MGRHLLLLIAAAALWYAMPSSAQTGTGAASAARLGKIYSKSIGLETIDASGNRKPVAPDTGYSFVIEKAQDGETVADVFRRKGLSTDAHTLAAIKTLNPDIKGFDTKLATDEPIHFVAPKDGDWASTGVLAVPPQTSMLAKVVFASHADELKKIRVDVSQQAAFTQFDDADRKVIDQAMARSIKSTDFFVSQAAAMTPRQRLIADAELGLTTSYFEKARSGTLVAAYQGNAGARVMETMSLDTAQFAKPASPTSSPPSLRVIVTPAGKASAESMDVYVLPILLLRYADQMPLAQIQGLLDGLKFPSPTSPSVYNVEPGHTYGVWIGGRDASDQMAQLVQSKKVHFQKFDATQIETNEITFNESERVPTK